MIVILGKGCSGKSTIAKILVEEYGYHQIPVISTRPKRNEDDNEYINVSDKEFHELFRGCKLMDNMKIEVANGSTWYYGTRKSDYVDIEPFSNTFVLSDPMRFRIFKSRYDIDDMFPVYIHANSDTIVDRMRDRNFYSCEEINRRMMSDDFNFAKVNISDFEYMATNNSDIHKLTNDIDLAYHHFINNRNILNQDKS